MGKTFFEIFDEFEERIQLETNFSVCADHFVQFQEFPKSVLKITHIIMIRMIVSFAGWQFIQSMHSMGWVVVWQGRPFSGYATLTKWPFYTKTMIMVEIGHLVRRSIVVGGVTSP